MILELEIVVGKPVLKRVLQSSRKFKILSVGDGWVRAEFELNTFGDDERVDRWYEIKETAPDKYYTLPSAVFYHNGTPLWICEVPGTKLVKEARGADWYHVPLIINKDICEDKWYNDLWLPKNTIVNMKAPLRMRDGVLSVCVKSPKLPYGVLKHNRAEARKLRKLMIARGEIKPKRFIVSQRHGGYHWYRVVAIMNVNPLAAKVISQCNEWTMQGGMVKIDAKMQYTMYVDNRLTRANEFRAILQ